MKHCNKCAAKTERKEFDTFSYDWCPKCKVESTQPTPATFKSISEEMAEEYRQDGGLPVFKDVVKHWAHVDVPQELRGIHPTQREMYQRMKFIDQRPASIHTLDQLFLDAMRLR